MDKLSLTALLDEDREMIQANLARDRALPAAQETLEKAVDRLMYRYVEACEDDLLRRSAQHILQSIKNTLPLMDAVGETLSWKRQGEKEEGGKLNFGPLTLVLLLLGLALVLASVLVTLIVGRLTGALTFVKALGPALLGCGALYWAGIRTAKPQKRTVERPGDTRTEYLVDGNKAWHCLRGAILQADGQLDRLREEQAVADQREKGASYSGSMDNAELELFAELLESAYAVGTDGARDSISAIRFYLHKAGVDAVDFEPGNERWFEFLPSDRPGTMRPALVAGSRLLKKGLASR